MTNGRKKRKVIAISDAGARREWDSEYACAKELGVSVTAIQQAKRWAGVCRGWRIFDSPAVIRDRIKDLENQLKVLEG